MCPCLSSAATHEQTAQTWPRLCWTASRYDDGVAFSVFAGVYGKLAEIAFASETSLRHTPCTRVLCRRWEDTKQPLASWPSSEDDSIPGIRPTKATHIDCFVKKKKTIFNSEEARARDDGDRTVQIRDLEPTTALTFGQGQRFSIHCIRAVSDPQRFSPPPSHFRRFAPFRWWRQ